MNVAIIGCNGMGRMHARMAAQCGQTVVACGDTHRRIAQSLAKEFDAQASIDSMKVIRRPDVDIVVIATPTPTHAQYIQAAAAAGKQIFCEKPMCRTVKECQESISAARKAGVKLFVGHVVRYFHEFETIRAQIEAGKVGRPGFVKIYRGGIFPRGVDDWFRDYEQSGGVTFDSMIHDLDWLRYVFGDAERVFCQNLQRKEPEYLDYAMATVRMKSGVIAKLIGTWAHPSGFRVEAEVCGDKGMVQFKSDDMPMALAMREKAGKQAGVLVPSSPLPVSPYQLEWEDFLMWLQGGTTVRVTPRDGMEAVRMAAAALKSAHSGRPVKV